MKIVMLPCAGGTSLMFDQLIASLPEGLTGYAVDYSGHGRRIQEPLYETIDEIVEDMLNEIVKLKVFNDPGYAILGYSMGATISYELTKKLVALGLALPARLFLCASPPSNSQGEAEKFLQSKKDLYDYLLRLGGTNKELLDNKEFQAYYFPIIEADMRALHYYHNPLSSSLSVPTTIIYGSTDNYLKTDMVKWEDYVKEVAYIEIAGGHFFVNERSGEMAKKIANSLSSY